MIILTINNTTTIMNLCQYKNLLGEPGTGFHAQRFLGFALWDIVGTFVFGWILSKFIFRSQAGLWGFAKSSIIMFALGTFLHYMFCVDTAFMKIFK